MRRLALVLGMALCAFAASAALRTIPPGTKRATMSPPQQGMVQLGGKAYRLSPGAQIRDRENRIVQPFAVREPVLVRYVLDSQENVFRVWILTPEEASQPDD